MSLLDANHAFICEEVHRQLKALESQHPDLKTHVYAAIVITDERNGFHVDVLVLATGTKCIHPEYLRQNPGARVWDCHAEVLARRGFKARIGEDLIRLIGNDSSSDLLEEVPDSPTRTFRFKPHLRKHLFISKRPCGDCSQWKSRKKGGRKSTSGTMRAKWLNRKGTHPPKPFAKDSRFKIMSCSDKVVQWNVTGVQGALFSQHLEPVYFDSIIIEGVRNHLTLVNRGINGRLEGGVKGLLGPYHVHHVPVHHGACGRELPTAKPQHKAAVWIKFMDGSAFEVIDTTTGQRADKLGQSILSKESFYRQYCQIDPNWRPSQFHLLVYNACKAKAAEYRVVKQRFQDALENGGQTKWFSLSKVISKSDVKI